MNNDYINLEPINQEIAAVWPGWTAVKLLGRGASGAVYEIHRYVRSNLEKAAMKVIRVPESDADAERLQFQGMTHQKTEEYYEKFVDSIHNEIRIMQRFVGNSHIVSYEDYEIKKRENRIGWDIYLRMELLTGLREYLQNNPREEKTVFKLGADILQALRDCHKSGIIHRDIKPANIFVNKAGNFKLGDFGVARTAPDISDTLSFKGTFGYMAPEVYLRMATDERSDLYSLGLVLYQCLNDNRLPFVPSDFTPEDIIEARKKRFAGEKIPEPAHGSKSLKDVVLKSLAYKPKDRYQTAQEMYSALEKAYKSEFDNNSDGGNSGGQGGISELLSKNAKLIRIIALAVAAVVILYLGKDPIGRFLDGLSNRGQTVTVEDRPEQPAGGTNEGAAVEQEGGAQSRSSETAGEQNDTDYVIEWNDEVLEEKVRELTGIISGDVMYSDVRSITEIDLNSSKKESKIENIDALSSFTGLVTLNLESNKISDISALANLKNLKELKLSGNKVSDVSPLSVLTNLESLEWGYNDHPDLSTLHGLKSLRSLELSYNDLNDISALSSMKNLESLNLEGNQIANLSALKGLTNLKSLNLGSNHRISDISDLRNMTELTSLKLDYNKVSNINSLKKLKKTTILEKQRNQHDRLGAWRGEGTRKAKKKKCRDDLNYKHR